MTAVLTSDGYATVMLCLAAALALVLYLLIDINSDPPKK
jgi:hypothetical protein